MFHYYQIEGGEESWRAVPAVELDGLVANRKPMFVTVLAVDRLLDEDTPREEFAKAAYSGPLYFDWDSPDIAKSTADCLRMLAKLEELGLNIEACRLYATGGKGYHLEVPFETLVREQKRPIPLLPAIFKEMAMNLAVDSLDLRVYSARRGRMWRQPNVLRPNGKYKVPISYGELQEMTPEKYEQMTAQPRPELLRQVPQYTLELAMLYERFKQKVEQVGKGRKARATEKLPNNSVSIEALLRGEGVRPETGFQSLSLQLAIIAHSYGWTADELVSKASGLIEYHESDGFRYNTPAKRQRELQRMWDYMEDNPCYDLSIGAIKSLLSHPAADLSGIPVSADEVREAIAQADEAPQAEDADGSGLSEAAGEYDEVVNVTLSRRGVYTVTDMGPKRICGVAFEKPELILDTESGRIMGLNITPMAGGRVLGQTLLDTDTFDSVQKFNRYLSRIGHAFQGNDLHLRSTFMRIVQAAKAAGSVLYTTAREGLDVLSISGAEHELARKPFLVWASDSSILLPQAIADTGMRLKFQGYPDPKGLYRSDLLDSLTLPDKIADMGPERAEETLRQLLTCQSPQFLSKVLGWMVACYFRMLFHKAYGKFPLLHVNGSAGAGKTESTKALLSLFWLSNEPRVLSPTSTAFALNYSAASSVTMPLVIDEYKPHEMPAAQHDRLKLMFRDAYNGRDVQRGGGSKDNEDYRTLHSTQLIAPIAFIAEAVEDEAALMERVVLATMVRPNEILRYRQLQAFMAFNKNKTLLTALGRSLMEYVVSTYSVESFRDEFDPMLQHAYETRMLTEADLRNRSLSASELAEKQGAKERSVYNYTVTLFGLRKFFELINTVLPNNELGELQKDLESHVYSRMNDLTAATEPEWLKVLNVMCELSYVDPIQVYALKRGDDYEFMTYGGKEALELNIHSAFAKYRIYCRTLGLKPLYAGSDAFVHGINDCPAFATRGFTEGMPSARGTHILYLEELFRVGFKNMKEQ